MNRRRSQNGRYFWWAVLACVAAAHGASTSGASTPATFTAGERSLRTTSSFAVLTDEFFGGKVRALKVLHIAKPITAEATADILENDGSSFTSDTEHVYFVLFLDDKNQISQVNFTIVLKGMTYGATVAATTEELARFASVFQFDGSHLKLASKGRFQDKDVGNGIPFTWDVKDDLPVHDIRSNPSPAAPRRHILGQ